MHGVQGNKGTLIVNNVAFDLLNAWYGEPQADT